MGPAGPTSISDLADSAGQDATAQAASLGWADVSFADGGRYVVATACDLASSGEPVLGRGPHPRPPAGRDACSARSPTRPVTRNPPRPSCPGRSARRRRRAQSSVTVRETAPDKALELRGPGRAARTIVTAAELKGVLGWPSATPVLLYADPNPDGSMLALRRRGGHPAGAASTAAGRRRHQPGRPYPGAHASPGGQRHRAMVTGRAADRPLPGQPGHPVQCLRLVPGPGEPGRSCSPGTTTSAARSCSGHRTEASSSTRPRRPERGLTQADNLQHGWTVIDLRSGRVQDVTAPGQPAAWLPAPGGRRAGEPGRGHRSAGRGGGPGSRSASCSSRRSRPPPRPPGRPTTRPPARPSCRTTCTTSPPSRGPWRLTTPGRWSASPTTLVPR